MKMGMRVASHFVATPDKGIDQLGMIDGPPPGEEERGRRAVSIEQLQHLRSQMFVGTVIVRQDERAGRCAQMTKPLLMISTDEQGQTVRGRRRGRQRERR